jgi:hypothetical protein
VDRRKATASRRLPKLLLAAAAGLAAAALTRALKLVGTVQAPASEASQTGMAAHFTPMCPLVLGSCLCGGWAPHKQEG